MFYHGIAGKDRAASMDEGRRGDREFGTIPRLVRAAAERHGERPAVVDGAEVLSFARLAGEVSRAASALIGLGVAPGDRVAVWAPNGWQWIVAALGAHSAGAAIVPINTRFKGEEAAYVLAKSRARILFTTTDFLGTDYVAMLRGAGQPASLETVVVTSGPAPEHDLRTLSWSSFVARSRGVPQGEADARGLAVGAGDLCDVMFTSGTTGRPKGATSTHAQTLRAFRDWSDLVGLRAGDRYLVVLPFFHSFGYKAGWLACLMMGATTYPLAVFDVNAVLDRVERDAITVMPGPPSLYQSILARADLASRKLSSLRLAVTGAAAIPVDLVGRMREQIGFQTVLTGYGLTEGTGVATLCREGDDAETIATTSGRAIPGVDVRVVDDEGREVPRGTPGEVVISGYTVTNGFFDDDAATAESLDAHGRLRTGDVGVMDERGYLRITDRKKDMFIVGGFNAYPAEIESVLCRHEGIAQVAVVGAPDERLGEVGVAFVVARAGARLDEQELVAWSRERMANYKVPRRFVAVDALPTNATGKVLKYKLREMARTL
jgi:acyl-CoA synthetase (AMP-forming)/AMP-acid ligase II